jgi:hypothetical protein
VALVLAYYALLRSIVRVQPGLRQCLTGCRHCQIFFLTHPRNAGRHDLRCPFGCRETHRQRQSNQRSTAYYREDRDKKRTQNAKRRKVPLPPPLPTPPAPEPPRPWPAPILEYVQRVTSLLPLASWGSDEVAGILKLLRADRAHALSLLEQARLVDELHTERGLRVAEIAQHLGRSKPDPQ